MKKPGKFFIAGIVLILLFLIYSFNDPAVNNLFPQCPFLTLTGFQCAGCGSQRAAHQILNGNIVQAFQYNPLFVLSLPYVLLGFLFEIPVISKKYPKVQSRLFGYKAIYVILGIIISFWILRNIL